MERPAEFGSLSHQLRAAWHDVRPAADLLNRFVSWFGELGFFCGELIRALFTTRFEWAEFAHQLDELGSKSMPIATLAGAATGVVLAQARAKVVRDYLVQNFKFDDTRVKIIGLGKSGENTMQILVYAGAAPEAHSGAQ